MQIRKILIIVLFLSLVGLAAFAIFRASFNNPQLSDGLIHFPIHMSPPHYTIEGKIVFYVDNYMDHSGYIHPRKTPLDADISTFKALSESYAKDDYRVFRDGKNMNLVDDPKTFEVLKKGSDFRVDGDYSKDKNHVYSDLYPTNRTDYRDLQIIAEADPHTFEVLGDGYSKDKNHVYNVYLNHLNTYVFRILSGADPNTFGILRDPVYSKDKNHVYYSSYILPEADTATFVILKNGYSKDKNNAYYMSTIIPEVDPNTFEVLQYNYSKDKNHVYLGFIKIKPEVDLKTFEPLLSGYSKDKDHVYFLNSYHFDIISGADPNTFKVVDNKFSKDMSHVYENGKIMIGVDPGTFEPPLR